MKIITTQAQIEAALTEWLRRYQQSPADVVADMKLLRSGDPGTYGQETGPYFVERLKEQGAECSQS